MENNIGRMQLCPCNSGKLYKNCHMRTYRPKEFFSVKVHGGIKAVDYHMVQKEGSDEWVKVPGRLSLMLGYAQKSYDDIDNLIRDIKEVVDEERYVLRERITRLKHKLYGIRYHMENFFKEEEGVIKNYNTQYEAPGTDSYNQNPKLIYETESFLFQIKSALDVFAQIISMIFNVKSKNTYSISDKGDNKIVKKLLEVDTHHVIQHEMADLLIKNDESWIRDAVDMRDEVTHLSDLKGFMCFVQHAWEGDEFARISYPSMPDGLRASTYMRVTYNKLFQLFFDASPILITRLSSKTS